jgi:hypothetical protein
MRARRPFQFSLATMMVAMTGYSLLFGTLRWLGISSPAFVMVTLYFTTVVYSQWAMFGGWNPFAASFLTGGGLLTLAFVADLQVSPGVLGFAFLAGGLIGIGVAGFTDIWLLLSQVMRGCVPKPWASERSPLDSPPDRDSILRERSSRSVRRAVLYMLAAVFLLGMVWGRITGQQWITATFREPGRAWRIPLD